MKCEKFKKNLYDFHDQLLSSGVMNEMESHLKECASCYEVNEKYKNFLNKFSSLPKSIKPERDLWENIKGKIEIKKSYNFNFKIKYLALAASFIIIILFSTLLFFYNNYNNSEMKILKQFNSASDEYNKARENLISALHSKEGIINKETIDLIENNLIIMDQAINEIKIAINKEPENQSLVLMLASAYHKETGLLLSTRDIILNINNKENNL